MTQRQSISRARGLAVLTVGGVLATALVGLQAAPASADVGSIASAVADNGAKVVKETVVDARTVDLTVSSPSVGTVPVRVMLPKNWATTPTLRWPTLYVFPSVDPLGYKVWTEKTDIEQVTAPDDVLVVIPEAGKNASFTDETTLLGKAPKWETFHTQELIQIIQRGYRSNGSNAVAGLSAGGYGALTYTFRHPGLYKATASYSGLTDLFDPAAKLSVLRNRVATLSTLNPWGPLLINYRATAAHNPQSNLAKFKGANLWLSVGRGKPGPLDTADPAYTDITGGRLIESAAAGMNDKFVAGLKRNGITPTTHFYDEGLHYWTYWNREFALSYPALKAAIGGPTTALAPAAAAPAPAKSSGLLGRLFGGLLGG